MTRPVEIKKFKAPPPSYDRNALYYPHDHGGDWVYEPREPFTKVDVIVPGHFDAYCDDLRVGARITCRLGLIQDGITEVELQVIEVPGKRRQGHVVVSVKGRDGNYTPVRHDGTLAEDEKTAPEPDATAADQKEGKAA